MKRFYFDCWFQWLIVLPVAVLGLKDNGVSCRIDDECASGLCSKFLNTFWTVGVCSDCNTDNDCEGKGISRPGELPMAFCHKQKGNSNICLPWKRGKPIGDEGYPVHLPGNGAVWVRRYLHEAQNSLEYEPAMSQIWRFDLNNQPEGTLIDVNATHVKIPLYAEILAGYSRIYHALDEEKETGVVTALFLRNPYSVITSKGHSAMLEKYHTLTYDGKLPTPKADRVEKELAERTEKQQRTAVKHRKARTLAMMSSIIPSKIVDSLIESGQDKVHWEKVRAYVKERRKEGKLTNDSDRLWLSSHRSNEAKEAVEVHAKTTSSLKSENHCKHFEDGYGIGLTKSHIEIPLNSPWVTVSGEMNYSPNYYMGLNNGIKIAKYDPETHALEFHYQAFQQWRHYADQTSNSVANGPSGLFIAPISPDFPVAREDGRSDQYYQDKPKWYMDVLANYRNIPVDYSLYDRDATCDEKTRERLADKWTDAKLEEAQVEDTDNVFEDLLDLHSLVTVVIDGATCPSALMRSDYGQNSTGMEILEFITWAHLILEADPEVTEDLATAQFWDDWDKFYKGDNQNTT
mmetsp:Transcript_9345/g.14410  ORF Transcript_9345/g.14410 Transcript_9345/m.14410 type:complete len:573 (+) Transcript_9345:13-1731(+)